MDSFKANIDKFIRSKFTEAEWEDLMKHIHSPISVISDSTKELKRRYWRLKKAQSRLIRRHERMHDPGFLDWLRRRGLPTERYCHAYWRDYNIDKGDADVR